MIHTIQTYSLSGGVELSFTDSGPPIGSLDYTTVILLHGGVFNAYGFHKVHDYAHRLNLRTVLLHRRDYAGSTPYSRSEIQELENGSVIFWERLSAQLGEFVRMFVEKESVPKLMGVQKSTSNAQMNGFRRGGSGGIAILGWSGGCLPIVSFLGVVRNRMMSEELYNFLVEYIGDLILYDPSYHCFGYPLPHDNRNYVPWEDQTISSEEFLHAFSEWVSSYYDHPCYDPVSRSLLVTASINDFDGQRRKSDEISVLSWTDEDLARGTEERPAKNEISTCVYNLSISSCFLITIALPKVPTRSTRNPSFTNSTGSI
ncbi:hypothetical protein EV361DRAFT_797953 [Lentinula raphanica]|uniref:Alpha beta-hydrolase n=1 Tax=Lentinula raphanica TaxID=153919 RepID=A0AA38UDD4_9AGAR|nr:hypothetical protein F5878DRAFT_201971 [Lentinula raphanica]KAJ3972514.1 hypothetical protein EV361DRAFT_797953 [Lentinula raphanica]